MELVLEHQLIAHQLLELNAHTKPVLEETVLLFHTPMENHATISMHAQ
jgi:hypothetical protein